MIPVAAVWTPLAVVRVSLMITQAPATVATHSVVVAVKYLFPEL